MSALLWIVAGWCGLNAITQEFSVIRSRVDLPEGYRPMIPLYWCATILAVGLAGLAA